MRHPNCIWLLDCYGVCVFNIISNAPIDIVQSCWPEIGCVTVSKQEMTQQPQTLPPTHKITVALIQSPYPLRTVWVAATPISAPFRGFEIVGFRMISRFETVTNHISDLPFCDMKMEVSEMKVKHRQHLLFRRLAMGLKILCKFAGGLLSSSHFPR